MQTALDNDLLGLLHQGLNWIQGIALHGLLVLAVRLLEGSVKGTVVDQQII
jgi:hypothetical protein